MRLLSYLRHLSRAHATCIILFIAALCLIYSRTEISPEEELISRLARAKGKHKILFHHNYKAGGHAMCRLAKVNGETATNAANDFLEGKKQSKGNKSNKSPFSLALSTRIFGMHGITEKYNEQRSLPQPTCDAIMSQKPEISFLVLEPWVTWVSGCRFTELDVNSTAYVSVTTIRDPVSRLASQFMMNLSQFRGSLRQQTPNETFHGRRHGHDRIGEHLLDNFQVRRAIGKLPNIVSGVEEVNWSDVEEITQKDLDFALQLADTIDIVIPTEEICRSATVLHELLNWDSTLFTSRPTSYTYSSEGMSMFEPDAAEEILQDNWADYELWKYAHTRLDRLYATLGVSPRENCPEVTYHYIKYNEVNKPNVTGSRRRDFSEAAMACNRRGFNFELNDTMTS